MSHARMSCAVLLFLYGCASSTASSPPPLAAEASQPLTAAALNGVWVEYWAPGGAADTEHYRFDAGGQFAWDARRAATGRGPVHKHGSFRVEPTSELVLTVQAEDFAACATCAADASAPRRVDHQQPIIERYELGECAPNVEAQARDEHYACVAIGGHAFWREPAKQ